MVVSLLHDRTSLLCSSCGTTLPMLTVDLAARIAGTTPLVVFRLAEAGRLHFAVSPEGRLLICSNSFVLNKAEDAGTTPNITQ
jgi:hypothetical protein